MNPSTIISGITYYRQLSIDGRTLNIVGEHHDIATKECKNGIPFLDIYDQIIGKSSNNIFLVKKILFDTDRFYTKSFKKIWCKDYKGKKYVDIFVETEYIPKGSLFSDLDQRNKTYFPEKNSALISITKDEYKKLFSSQNKNSFKLFKINPNIRFHYIDIRHFTRCSENDGNKFIMYIGNNSTWFNFIFMNKMNGVNIVDEERVIHIRNKTYKLSTIINTIKTIPILFLSFMKEVEDVVLSNMSFESIKERAINTNRKLMIFSDKGNMIDKYNTHYIFDFDLTYRVLKEYRQCSDKIKESIRLYVLSIFGYLEMFKDTISKLCFDVIQILGSDDSVDNINKLIKSHWDYLRQLLQVPSAILMDVYTISRILKTSLSNSKEIWTITGTGHSVQLYNYFIQFYPGKVKEKLIGKKEDENGCLLIQKI